MGASKLITILIQLVTLALASVLFTGCNDGKSQKSRIATTRQRGHITYQKNNRDTNYKNATNKNVFDKNRKSTKSEGKENLELDSDEFGRKSTHNSRRGVNIDDYDSKSDDRSRFDYDRDHDSDYSYDSDSRKYTESKSGSIDGDERSFEITENREQVMPNPEGMEQTDKEYSQTDLDPVTCEEIAERTEKAPCKDKTSEQTSEELNNCRSEDLVIISTKRSFRLESNAASKLGTSFVKNSWKSNDVFKVTDSEVYYQEANYKKLGLSIDRRAIRQLVEKGLCDDGGYATTDRAPCILVDEDKVFSLATIRSGNADLVSVSELIDRRAIADSDHPDERLGEANSILLGDENSQRLKDTLRAALRHLEPNPAPAIFTKK